MKILMIKNMETNMIGENSYSVEAGFADNIKNFDHHGKFAKYPAPCNNEAIKPLENQGDVSVYVTHIDADTIVGIIRLLGRELPNNIDFSLMEKIDLNGSSVCQNKFDTTLLYMVGIGQLTRTLGIPRAEEEPKDITSLVMELINTPTEDIISLGREATEKSEASYRNCLVEKQGDVAFFSIGENDPLDPSRPYEDGQEIVIVYRKHYKSISIYCAPNSKYEFAGQCLANIEFAGHPKACGSPRGVSFEETDASKVYKEIVETIS